MNESPRGLDDASPGAARDACAWCGRALTDQRGDARFCGQRCRQAAFRLRRRRATEGDAARAMRFAYADPPYPGRARRLYGCDEVDHARLIAFLLERFPDGWALSTAEDALRDLLPLCPPPPLTHVCPWVKPIAPSSRTHGLHTCWEPLIVVGGRRRPPGRRDWLRAQPARFGGTLVGRKPLAFCAWLFDCLGAVAGDELVDLFPGTGIVGRAWAQVSPAAADDASFLPPHCLKKNGTPAARHSKRGHLYYLVFAGPKEKGAEIASHILGGGEKIK